MNISTSSGACSWIGTTTTDGVVSDSNISSSNMQSHGGSSTGPGNGGTPCGACKFLRRKCMKGCVFAPYFLSEQGTEGFCAVHKVFGASNVSKLLLRIPLPEQRCQAVLTIKYEAQARLRDPVYGCVRTIFALERQVERLQAELEFVRAQLITSSRQLAIVAPTLYQQRQQEMQAIDNYATLMHTVANPAPASSWCNNNYMYTATSCNPDHWSPSSNSAHNYSSMKGEAEHVDAAAAHYNYDHYLSIMNCTLSDFGLEALQMASSPDHNMLKLDFLQRSIFSLDPQHANEADLH